MDAAKLACLKLNDSTTRKKHSIGIIQVSSPQILGACSIRLVITKYDENGFAVDVSCEELKGI